MASPNPKGVQGVPVLGPFHPSNLALTPANGLTAGAGAGVQQGVAANPPPARRKSDPRFRSFAERYVAARCHLFSSEASKHAADQWECVQDAKRVYNMIRSTGENIDPEDM